MSSVNLAAVLAHHADRFPDRACLVWGAVTTSAGDTFLDKGATVRKIGSVGKPCLHVEVAIWDDTDTPLAPGTWGNRPDRGDVRPEQARRSRIGQ